MIDRLNELDIRMHIRQIPGEKQPRAWNIFGVKEDPDHRAFEWETSEGMVIDDGTVRKQRL